MSNRELTTEEIEERRLRAEGDRGVSATAVDIRRIVPTGWMGIQLDIDNWTF